MEQIDTLLPTLIALYLGLAGLLFPVLLIAFVRQRRRLPRLASAHQEELDAVRAGHKEQLRQLEVTQSEALAKYSAIISVEDEVAKLEEERQERVKLAEREDQDIDARRKAKEDQIESLRAYYKEKREIYDRLKKELAIFDERLSFAELGVYEPHFDFGDSEAYKVAIKAVREDQKLMVSRKTAVYCTTTWTVDGSQSKGQTMINRAVRLTLRAFNNECEAAIANTRWNNVQAMEKRIERARTAIDKLNASNSVIIADHYFEAKIKELRLTHEYRETLKKERDERAEAARSEREEKRLLQEAKAAEKEEQRYQDLLAKARAEVGIVTSEEHEAKIRALEDQLAAAHEKTERAKAMAEQTKSGFVYIISNIGSFGEDVVKIGLTRRLDPMDRVRELGDASVPFLFDPHAMIYSEEAPALETALHSKFADRRINASNMRKEFFRVSLEEVEAAVRELAPTADFHTDIEAQEFYETLARRKELAEQLARQESEELPTEI
jgi:DNA repair exonuclease SbcCD ATPase subunit